MNTKNIKNSFLIFGLSKSVKCSANFCNEQGQRRGEIKFSTLATRLKLAMIINDGFKLTVLCG